MEYKKDTVCCQVCDKVIKDGVAYDGKCEECYDDEYSGCYGGGCVKDNQN
jgi:hypothetical protein